jgi:hypothetical protein
MGSLVLTVTMLGPGVGTPLSWERPADITAMARVAASNQMFGAYLADGEHSRLNGLSPARLRWTNAEISSSIGPSLPYSGTNRFRL